ncbi:MAG: acyltransferase [Polyangiaceae bacterium]|nr:acyltransferase [Polyangiaceae bacterium]
MNNASHPVTRSLLAPILLGLLLPVTVVSYAGCKKEEPPPPLPSAAPVSTPSAPLELAIEDAGDEGDADAEAGPKKTGPYKPAPSLKACCNALAQNAANAPPPTNAYMLQAAAACNAAVAQGKSSGSVLAVVRGALKGAGMPAACH